MAMADSTQPSEEDKAARRAARKRITNREWRAANKKRRCLSAKESYKRNRAKIISRCKAYYWANRDAVIKKKSIYMAKRRAANPCFRLSQVMASRVRGALARAGKSKSGRAMTLIGCTANELKAHLESLFLPGMTWSNRGRHGWHIDHIIPLSRFDLADPAQQASAFHYTNLQPLWAVDNLKKSNKVAGQNLFGFAYAARIADAASAKPKGRRKHGGQHEPD